MRLLLSGHKGFIGSNFLKALDGYDVVTYEWGEPLPKIQGLDWVIHVGAISSTIETDVNKIMRQNYDFSCWLLDECIKHGVKMQFSSSASIYGLNMHPSALFAINLQYQEDGPVDPRTPYSWSKYMFEKYAERKSNETIIQCFRYFNVYGPNEEHKGTQASPFCQFEKQAKENGRIKVFKDSDTYCRDFIHVDEVIDIQKAFFSVRESGVWNVGTGQTMSFMQVAKKFDVPIDLIDMPENLKHSYQKYTCADMRKTRTTMEKYNV